MYFRGRLLITYYDEKGRPVGQKLFLLDVPGIDLTALINFAALPVDVFEEAMQAEGITSVHPLYNPVRMMRCHWDRRAKKDVLLQAIVQQCIPLSS